MTKKEKQQQQIVVRYYASIVRMVAQAENEVLFKGGDTYLDKIKAAKSEEEMHKIRLAYNTLIAEQLVSHLTREQVEQLASRLQK